MEFTAQILNELHPMHVIMSSHDHKETSIAYLINYYNQNRRISRAVLHGVLLTSIKGCGGKLPHINYLNKTLNTWIKNKINTPAKAAEKLNELANWKNKGIAPSWLDEYYEDMDKMKAQNN